eukprot:2528882-Prymnesium_polylepis.1
MLTWVRGSPRGPTAASTPSSDATPAVGTLIDQRLDAGPGEPPAFCRKDRRVWCGRHQRHVAHMYGTDSASPRG